MPKKYHVDLTEDQRRALEARLAGPLTLRQRNRVEVLLRADAGDTDAEIAEALGIATNTVANIRTAVRRGGASRPPSPSGPAAAPRRSSTASRRRLIIALACGPTDDGQARWSVRRLAERAVEPGGRRVGLARDGAAGS